MQIKGNIKVPRHWPLCGEFTDNRWIPSTKGQWRGKCFHLMTSLWEGGLVGMTQRVLCRFINRLPPFIYPPSSCYTAWWRHQMETFSALLALCEGNSPVTGEFPSQRPVTRSFDVFFDLRLNTRLSKQPWCRWNETPSCSLWRQLNALSIYPSGGARRFWIGCWTLQMAKKGGGGETIHFGKFWRKNRGQNTTFPHVPRMFPSSTHS